MLRHRLLQLSTLVFLLLCIATVATWIDSYRALDAIAGWKLSNAYALVSFDGRVIFNWNSPSVDDDIPWPRHVALSCWRCQIVPTSYSPGPGIFTNTPTKPQDIYALRTIVQESAVTAATGTPDVRRTMDVAGVIAAAGQVEVPYHRQMIPVFIFQTPHWLLTLLFTYGLGRASWILFQQCKRRKPGNCRRCGYDLRGSMGRCPECGTAIQPLNPFATQSIPWRKRFTLAYFKRRNVMFTRLLRRNVYWIISTCMLLMVILYQAMRPPLNRPSEAAAYLVEEQAMNRAVTINFKDIPIKKVFEQWSSEASVNIIPEWKACNGIGVDGDTAVTLKTTSPVPLHDALLMLCAAFDGLDFDIHSTTVRISSKDRITDHTVTTVVYAVDDLVVPKSLSGDTMNQNPDDRVQALANVVTRTVEPDAWRDSGGQLGRVTVFGDHIVISASYRMHRQIAHLLDQMRAAELHSPR
jgi:hypothetical protein